MTPRAPARGEARPPTARPRSRVPRSSEASHARAARAQSRDSLTPHYTHIYHAERMAGWMDLMLQTLGYHVAGVAKQIGRRRDFIDSGAWQRRVEARGEAQYACARDRPEMLLLLVLLL